MWCRTQKCKYGLPLIVHTVSSIFAYCFYFVGYEHSFSNKSFSSSEFLSSSGWILQLSDKKPVGSLTVTAGLLNFVCL